MHHHKITVKQLCDYYHITRQGYYKRRQYLINNKIFESRVLKAVKLIRAEQPELGCRKLQDMLRSSGLMIGRDRLFDLLRRNNLLSQVYRRKKYRTSSGTGTGVKHPNLVKDHAPVKEPGDIIASDITCLYTKRRRLYLSLTSDYCSDYILGYSLRRDYSTDGPLAALKQARKKLGKKKTSVIHHSDHGSQYTSDKFQETLIKYGYKPSMTGIGKCYDNPKAERINGILKHELGLKRVFRDYAEALIYVKDAIKIYNEKRIIITKGYKTPNEILNAA
jgi:transposase InsO family protein